LLVVDFFHRDDVDGDVALFTHLAVEEVIVLLALDNEGLPGCVGNMVLNVGSCVLVLWLDLSGCAVDEWES
jgi:hypothetical protein